MRKINYAAKFDLSTYDGRYKAYNHAYNMGDRKRPPSKRLVLEELAAEAKAEAEAEVKVKVKVKASKTADVPKRRTRVKK